MPGPNRAVAALCIAVVAIAAFLPPGLATLDAAWFEPAWVCLPPDPSIVIAGPPVAPDEQPVPLFSIGVSRAPPHNSFA